VSMNVSPFDKLLPEEEKSMVSAPNRRAASEKLVRVRVEFSKNRFAHVRPARSGSFCVQSAEASLSRAAVSKIVVISSADSDSRSSKCRLVQESAAASNCTVAVLM